MKKKFIIGGVILVIILIFLVYTGLKGAPTYTLSEFLNLGTKTSGELVRVQGIVESGSIVQKTAQLSLTFTMVGEGASLPVAYQGTVPDTFKAGADVVVEGKLDPAGVFQATTLMPKCPSKYLAK